MLEHIKEAVAQLNRSEKGRDAMAHLRAWFDSSACSLDTANQDAVFTLLELTWNGHVGWIDTRDVIEEAIGPPKRR